MVIIWTPRVWKCGLLFSRGRLSTQVLAHAGRCRCGRLGRCCERTAACLGDNAPGAARTQQARAARPMHLSPTARPSPTHAPAAVSALVHAARLAHVAQCTLKRGVRRPRLIPLAVAGLERVLPYFARCAHVARDDHFAVRSIRRQPHAAVHMAREVGGQLLRHGRKRLPHARQQRRVARRGVAGAVQPREDDLAGGGTQKRAGQGRGRRVWRGGDRVGKGM
eukprot:366203-Chlamydomonas_euryale.AAC.3